MRFKSIQVNGQLAINKRSGFHEYVPHDRSCEYYKTNRYLRAISKGKPCVFEEKKPKRGKILVFDEDENEGQATGEMNAADQETAGDQLNEPKQTNLDGQVGEESEETQADRRADCTIEGGSLEEALNKLDDLLQRLVLHPIAEEQKTNLKEKVRRCTRLMDQLMVSFLCKSYPNPEKISNK